MWCFVRLVIKQMVIDSASLASRRVLEVFLVVGLVIAGGCSSPTPSVANQVSHAVWTEARPQVSPPGRAATPWLTMQQRVP